MSTLIAPILFKMLEKNVIKIFFPPFKNNISMVCLLLIAAGIPAVKGGMAFRTAGVR
jgi:hypothetical protein